MRTQPGATPEECVWRAWLIVSRRKFLASWAVCCHLSWLRPRDQDIKIAPTIERVQTSGPASEAAWWVDLPRRVYTSQTYRGGDVFAGLQCRDVALAWVFRTTGRYCARGFWIFGLGSPDQSYQREAAIHRSDAWGLDVSRLWSRESAHLESAYLHRFISCERSSPQRSLPRCLVRKARAPDRASWYPRPRAILQRELLQRFGVFPQSSRCVGDGAYLAIQC